MKKSIHLWQARLCLLLIGIVTGSMFSPAAFATEANPFAWQITGKVTLKGEALPGVAVVLKGTTVGTSTDTEGNYTLSVPESPGTLIFSFIGTTAKEMPFTGPATINVSLTEDSKALQEVQVVGYGTQKKSQVTGAISSLSSREISEMPITNARQAIQGRAAGVDVVQAGSKPGAGPQIRIRGRRSFNASNDPLYVVDGIPLSGGIDDINPQDIASMEVLKDASATAIYGSRGSNGVVIITTKRGVAGKTVVTYDTFVGINSPLGRVEVLDGPGFAEYKRESRRAIGQYPLGPATDEADEKIFEPVELESIRSGRSTDYVDAMLRTGMIQSHQLGVSGGSEKTTFNISGNYFEDKGVVKKQDFSRYTFRVNLDHKINDKLRVGTSSLFVYSIRNGENFNPLGGAFAENPLGRPYNEDGTINFLPTNDGLRTNPLAEIVDGAQVDETKRYRIFNSIYGEWDIAEGLKYRLNFGPDVTVRRSGRFTGSETNARRGGAPTGGVYEEFVLNYTIENILTYNKQFNEVHNLNFTGLQSIQKDRFENSSIDVLGIPDENQQYYRLGDANQILGSNTDLRTWTLLSFMGRANYDYKNKYLLTATIRADGSSRFGENTKFGYFPSVALGWNLSEESFMSGVNWLDMAKLRVSYGVIGNTAIDPYQTQALLGRTSYAWDNTPAYGYRPNTIGNPDLRWETSKTANAGLDFSLFSGRVSGSLEYYVTNTTALLAPQPLPTSIGFGGYFTNIGHTRNQGIEATVTTVNIDKGDFTWSTDFVFTRNREAIIELANGKVDDVAAGRFIGQPLSVFFDYRKLGIWQADQADEALIYQDQVGQVRVEDVNNDGKINADDRQILGSAVPDFAGGITNRITFKNFDFSFFVFGRYGQLIRSRFHDSNNLLAGRYNNLAVDYWTPNNPTNNFPQPVVTQEFPKYASSLTYFDGSFLKVRNINLGYNVPASFASKLRMESLRVYTSIQQPFIFASYRSKYQGIDPETYVDGDQGVGGGEINANVAPATKVFTFGINARF
ncbi:SusC/RagA family TonB-linked outer membrane protein [Pontibacter pamirensis]|uniref:SusC/RagA family TonB-linked outer membrane protein n=1 Tax=Pontibacter pamirensis TaxID=2562824 RepID=UPI001389B3B5|nr:TonB-dependent receptor [Pontibacter pamirensis]